MDNQLACRIFNAGKLLSEISQKKIECTMKQEYERGALLRDLEKVLTESIPAEDFLSNISSLFDEAMQVEIALPDNKEFEEKIKALAEKMESKLK